MKPILLSLNLGGHEVGLHTYGILIGCGCALGIALAVREARRHGFDGGKILDLAFWMLVTGLLGSRLLYVALDAGGFARACVDGAGSSDAPRSLGAVLADCSRVLQVWEGGLVFYGGVLAAGLLALWFARRQGWSFWVVGDIFAPSLAIGHALGRLGCFAAGCCFGKLCDPASAARRCVAFPETSAAFDQLKEAGLIASGATATPPLFPTQLYEAAGELAIFALLLLARRRLRDRAPGTLLLLYAVLYGVLRLGVEVFRGDVARRYLVELTSPRLARTLGLPPREAIMLSTGQLMSALIVLAAAALFLQRRRRATTR